MADGVKYNLAHKADSTNLIDYSTWTPGNSSATGFTTNGESSENLIITDRCPFGEQGPIWKCYNTDVASDGEGGFTVTNTISIDSSKTYRYSCWMKHNGIATIAEDGRYYQGCYGYGTTTNGLYYRSNGTLNNNNPYFFGGLPLYTLLENEWILFVGHIWPAGSGTGSNHADSGMYTIADGLISSSVNDFVWDDDSDEAKPRTYFFYSDNPDVIMLIAYPRFEIVDGSEPSIEELLNGWGGYSVDSATRDSNFYFRSIGDMGPTPETHYWTGITPPAGGYTLYSYKQFNGPSIVVLQDDSDFVSKINAISGESYTTPNQAIAWVNSEENHATDKANDLKTGLVACWEFEESSSTIAYDSHSTHNINRVSGTITAAVSGEILDNNFYFNYAGMRTPTNDTAFNPTSAYTTSMWIKNISASAAAWALMCYNQSSSAYNWIGPYVSRSVDNDSIGMYARTSSGVASAFYRLDPGTIFKGTDDIWHHYVCVWNRYDPEGIRCRIYLDNVYGAGGAGYDANIVSVTGTFQIGNYGNNRYFTGNISQAAFWTTALTAQQVNILYNQGYGLRYSFWL